jgi:hypothetical protein
MRLNFTLLFLIVAVSILAGCNRKGSIKKESQAIADTITVPDTGYTGIKQYMSGRYLIKEVTFKNGVREGLMKSFYQTGEVRQTFWYEKGLREDSARWYFPEGQLFRTTPYRRDTAEGIQKQFYRNGRVKAKIGYSKGLRTTFIQEFTQEGKLVGNYPTLVVNMTDNYKTKGIYRLSLELSNKSTDVRYWRGDLSNNLFDSAHVRKINTIKGVGILDLKKTSSPKPASVGVIAEILTAFGNKQLVYKKIDLPYNDLN